jgi:hypothetical protein
MKRLQFSNSFNAVDPQRLRLARTLLPFRAACRQHLVAQHLHINRSFATVNNGPKLPFEATCASVTPLYERLVANLKTVKRVLDNEPLTLAEKILYSHLTDAEESLAAGKGNIRGQSYLKLNPDRVAMQGISALRSGKLTRRCQCTNGYPPVYGEWIG